MTALANISIDQALRDEHLLGAALGPSDTWDVWMSVLRAAFGEKLTKSQRLHFDQVAGGREPPARRVRELWAVCGRRSGKTRMSAAMAVFASCFVDYSDRLSPGETGYCVVIAPSRSQARLAFDYCLAFIQQSPILAPLIDNVTSEEIRLRNHITISVHSASFRTIRGRSLVAAVFDEAAFWRSDDAAEPDVEILRACLPALSTVNGMIIGISSPHSQRGLVYARHRDYFGQPGDDVLVIQAASTVLNPTLDEALIATARRDDPEAASSEWDALFRSDLSTFIDRAIVEGLVETGCHERPYDRSFKYYGFVDMSGGNRDAAALGIAHKEHDFIVLDVAREVPAPHSPPDVAAEFARIMQAYRVTTCVGDRYAGQWPVDAFHESGIRFVHSPITRSEIYLHCLPHMMAGTIRLLDNTRLVGQIAQLERRATRSGRDQVDHQRGAHDDLANAACGALSIVPAHVSAWRKGSRMPKAILAYADQKRHYGRDQARIHRPPERREQGR